MPKGFRSPESRRRRVAEREADVRYNRYLRPIGTRGVSRVEVPGTGGLTKLVTNSAGLTFAPGTLVPCARHLDDPRETIIGRPPLGQRGALATLRTSYSIGPAVEAASEGLGYHHDGAGLWSLVLYRAGSPYAVVETLASFDSGDAVVSQLYPIATDSAGKVADNSLAYGVGVGEAIEELAVVDLAGEVAYRRSAAAGRYSTGGHFKDGWLYWVEFEQTTTGGGDQVARGYKARADFTDVEALGTATLPNEITEQDWRLWWSALTESSIIGELNWDDPVEGEVSGYGQFRIPLAGGAGSENIPSPGWGTQPVTPGVPAPGGGAYLPAFDGVYLVADDVNATPAEEWPDGWNVLGVANVAVADGRAVAFFDDGDGPKIAAATAGGPYGTAPVDLDPLVNPLDTPRIFVPR